MLNVYISYTYVYPYYVVNFVSKKNSTCKIKLSTFLLFTGLILKNSEEITQNEIEK